MDYAVGMALTTKQELFMRALLADPKRNATAAAVAAGYSQDRAQKTANELLAHPEIQLALREKEMAALESAHVDPAYVIEGIRDTIERCRGLGKAFNPISALRGFELLGKYLKLWTDRVELNEVGDLADRIRQAFREEEAKVKETVETGEAAPIN